MSPFVSEAQRRFFHTDTAKKKGITQAMVNEFDEASRGKKLPERAGNTSYEVIPPTYPTDEMLSEMVEAKPSRFVEIAGTNTSQVQTTPITAYRGSADGY